MKSTTKALVVALEGPVEPELRRVAEQSALPVLEATDADEAFREIARIRPPAVVVQVSALVREAVKLIRLVASAARPVPVIAAATAHQDTVEQAVRDAGATCYLPNSEISLLGQVLAALVPQEA